MLVLWLMEQESEKSKWEEEIDKAQMLFALSKISMIMEEAHKIKFILKKCLSFFKQILKESSNNQPMSFLRKC